MKSGEVWETLIDVEEKMGGNVLARIGGQKG